MKLNYPERHLKIDHLFPVVPKIGKDLYYAYYVLRYAPNFEVLLKNISKFKKSNEAKIVIKNLNKYFRNIQSEGVLLIEKEVGLNIYSEDIREDIFQRFQKLKDCF